ncbi:hypothetical protein CXB51_025565 [Gossypium anomalum]|uniref:Uncharacterized protein n=1 Tax=Gossypium anomalum TaxID=47600 RepID=A0A8J5YGS0_9ROSI|nr:hypothetical protein CXB51_025565 [Gossypium anomalum]
MSEPIMSNPSTTKDKQNRDNVDFVKFLNLFISLNVDLPLLEIINKIPKYAKYLKKIMKQHRKMEKDKQIDIDASCSALIATKIPLK